jgi:hypothetical protein
VPQLGTLVLVNLLLGFSVPGIDNAAHIGAWPPACGSGSSSRPAGSGRSGFWQGDQPGRACRRC